MVRKQVDQRTSDLGAQVTSTSEDLRHIGEKLRDEDQDTPAQLADKAAEQAKRVGRYLNDADADTLIADVEDLGRRQPMLVLAGGVVLGIAAARFLKASSSRRYEQSAGNRQQLASAATALGSVGQRLRRDDEPGRCGGAYHSAPGRDSGAAASGSRDQVGDEMEPNGADAQQLHDRSTGELVGELSQQTSSLIRQEIALAKAELTDTGKNAGKGAGMIGGAGAIGYLAAAALTTAIIALLDKAMDTWIAALIVARRLRSDRRCTGPAGPRRSEGSACPRPEQTVETIKEDVQWAKTQARSVRK